VSKFKSLAAELEGHYGKPEHHLPDDLRARVRRAFAAFYPWDVLSSEQQRDWASRWWRGRAAFQEDAQRDPALDEQDFQSGWDSIAKPEALKRQILEWEATSTPTATDLEKKELRLAELRRELASLIPGRPTSTADDPQEQSVAPAKGDAPSVTGERTTPPRGRAGRPAEWGWDAALAHLTALANTPDGLPEVQADAERIVEKYFADRNGGNSPAMSRIREKVGPIYQAIAQMKAQGRKSAGRL
jgi:hypothetical protein